jgi:hypothetical protein
MTNIPDSKEHATGHRQAEEFYLAIENARRFPLGRFPIAALFCPLLSLTSGFR